MVPYKELFGARVKHIRESHGWTQENLTERMDISTNYLSSIERGKENPTFDMLVKLATALEAEMWELFDFEHEKNLKELRDGLNKFAKEAEENKLRLAFRILRVIFR